MRAMSADMKAAIAREDVALVYLLELTLKEGTVYRYTDNVSAIRQGGFLWRADPGINVSALRDSVDQQSQTATVVIAFAPDMLTEQVARKGGLDGATFRLLCCDWRQPQLDAFEVFSGHVDKLTASNPFTCSIDLTGWQVRSVQITGAYSMKCRNVFCDQGCKLNLADYSFDFTIQGAPGQPIAGGLFGMNITVPDGAAAYGSVLWKTGRNAGEVSLIAYNAGTQVQLAADPPYTPRAGETGTLREGCDFYADTCENRFHNLLNFQGEPATPQGTVTSADKSTTTTTVDPVKPPPSDDVVITAATNDPDPYGNYGGGG